MHWGQIIVAFILGALLGPWVMSMLGGKNKQSTAY